MKLKVQGAAPDFKVFNAETGERLLDVKSVSIVAGKLAVEIGGNGYAVDVSGENTPFARGGQARPMPPSKDDD